jgi:hypothetical protein
MTEVREALRELAGTLTHKEVEEMQKLIDEDFEKIEGERQLFTDVLRPNRGTVPLFELDTLQGYQEQELEK